jgi:hypothetical protein
VPFRATYVDASLVEATAHLVAAAEAEGLKGDAIATLWKNLGESVRIGLVAYASDPVKNGSTLEDWRDGYPRAFAEHSDEEASALIRVAVALAGGVVVNDDGSVTEASAAVAMTDGVAVSP